ncbi:MAG: hypothetical protein BroJett014_27820 [Planctomycetota bacterium]|nr:MAG: hypothetical protein BroJett014_27820 [Planctomycetota bacterium]
MNTDEKDNKLHAFIDGPPVTKGSDIGLPANHPFAGFDVVSQYTDDDAIDDGMLIDVTHEAKDAGLILPRVLVSRGIFTDVLAPRADIIGEREGEPVIDVRKALHELLCKFSDAVKAAGKGENEYWWFDFIGASEKIKACHNGHGRITFCYPSED